MTSDSLSDDEDEAEDEVDEDGEDEGERQVIVVGGRRHVHTLVGVVSVEHHCLLHPALQPDRPRALTECRLFGRVISNL